MGYFNTVCTLLPGDILQKVLRLGMKMEAEHGTLMEDTEGEKRSTEKAETYQNSWPI
jgi:hypothetical protein